MGVTYPGFVFNDDPGVKKLTHEQWAALYEDAGMPGDTFAFITKGESGYAYNVQQKDPGDGMVGLGGPQLTPNAWGDGPAKQKFEQLGGARGMQDVRNQIAMAKYLYEQAGNSTKPWYGQAFVKDQNSHYKGNLKAADVYASLGIGTTVGGTTEPSSGGGLVAGAVGTATKGLLWIGLLLGGAALFVVGIGRIASTGATPA